MHAIDSRFVCLGLSVHMSQVHKEQLTEIENALPNRAGTDVEIFGMEGVPDDVLQAHQQRVASQFSQAEADRQAVTGNPPAGGGGQPAKRPKLEATSDLKKRLAEHRAKKAEAAAGGSSGDATPVGAAQTGSTPTTTVHVFLTHCTRPIKLTFSLRYTRQPQHLQPNHFHIPHHMEEVLP